MMPDVHFRPSQQQILGYQGGWMGISAVPGSGKTFTLSALAAQLVRSDLLQDDQEVLIVTLVNSAVHNFAARVAAFIESVEQIPNIGYRVRTLHGLAHDIVREHPSLVGLADDFQIIDEREAERIRQDVAEAWLRANPHWVDDLLDPGLEESRRDWVRRDKLPEQVSTTASNFIRLAKDRQQTPATLRDALPSFPAPLPLAEMGLAIYADYQRALSYRGAVDFDDLVRLALLALQLDADYRQRLQHRWPYILEDEAQDSSQVQEDILKLLVGPGGNWVRVGDPNQAIYETFTTASPQHLRTFLVTPGVSAQELPNSGRSTPSIMKLANYLIDWTRQGHPLESEQVQEALTPPHIEPTPPGDPQPNPPDDPTGISLIANDYTPREELLHVVRSVRQWLSQHQQETVAILVPRNQRGFEIIGELKQRNVPYVELLRSTQSTRETAGALGNIVNYLADPANPTKLARVYQVWRREERQDPDATARLEKEIRALRGCRRVEDFLWPRVVSDWLRGLDSAGLPQVQERLTEFRNLARRWQEATVLPIDQLILTLAQDLFQEPVDLAVAHKLAGLLRRASDAHPDWQLPELTDELAVIARNERRFLGLSEDDTGFDPDKHKGKVVVATVHKAKGLEWDRVYLMSVNNYNFPSGQLYDSYIAERWFIREGLNLEAEALAQLKTLLPEDRRPGYADTEREGALRPLSGYVEGKATQQARLDYVAERLRLLYVGITRARRDLIITWNTGRRRDLALQEAIPLVALRTFWERERRDSSS